MLIDATRKDAARTSERSRASEDESDSAEEDAFDEDDEAEGRAPLPEPLATKEDPVALLGPGAPAEAMAAAAELAVTEALARARDDVGDARRRRLRDAQAVGRAVGKGGSARRGTDRRGTVVVVGRDGHDEARRRRGRGANARRRRVQGETVSGGADLAHGARVARFGGCRGFGRRLGSRLGRGFGRRLGRRPGRRVRFRRVASAVRTVRGRGRGGVRSNPPLEDDAERSFLAKVPRGAGGRSRGFREKRLGAGTMREATERSDARVASRR